MKKAITICMTITTVVSILASSIGCMGPTTSEQTPSQPVSPTPEPEPAPNIDTDSETETAALLFQKGYAYQQEGEYSHAIDNYEEIIKKFASSSDALKAEKALPECYYNFGLELEERGEYRGGQHGGAIKAYGIILDDYPDSLYAVKIERFTNDNSDLNQIAEVDCYVVSKFYGEATNKSNYYIIEVTIDFQLYLEEKPVYNTIVGINGLEPGEHKKVEESPFLTILSDDDECKVIEIWCRVME